MGWPCLHIGVACWHTGRITYVGCFDTEGSTRYYDGVGSIDFCASDHDDALTGAVYYFGMEFPQGKSTAGESDCLPLPSDPSTWGEPKSLSTAFEQKDDSECEGERLI